MDGKSFLRRLFFISAVASVVLLTVITLPPHPNKPSLLECSTNSAWCTAKNRILRRPAATAAVSHDHAADVPHHPLDPLTIQEMNRVHKAIKSFFAGKAYSVHSLVAEEPDKEVVLRWRKPEPLPPRKASVIARAAGKNYIMTVDVESGEITQHDAAHISGYPYVSLEDMQRVIYAPFASADFNRTILARGVDLNDVACLPFSPGWFGEAEDGRRLVKLECFSMKDTANFYMRPIEGVIVVTDLDTNQIVEIIDKGKHIPIPKAEGSDYRLDVANGPIIKLANPVSMEQPNGPNFVIEDEHLVKWANWEFHLKPDPRAGVMISRARARDPETGVMRDVMYQGFSSELFVPYMDPEEAWYFKTYMDAGEYGFGLQALALEPLNECPRNARYMDAVFAASDGTPYVRSNMICLFERYAGDAAWRHTENPFTGKLIREARPKISLVVRMVASLANYDYVMDWEFHADGLIHAKETPRRRSVSTEENFSECGRQGPAVKPRKGDALLFYSLYPDATPDTASLHAGCPVEEGEKWSATKWIHVDSFDRVVGGNNCTDSNDNCERWASLRECNKNPEYMVGSSDLPGYCRKSCKAC